MSRHALRLLLALLVAGGWALPAAPAAAAAGWALPAGGGRGAVVAGFTFERGRPFAAGARRGVDLRAAPGAVVRAPCTGRVSFAGRVPGRGTAVTVRCGSLAATVLGLGRAAVRAGAPVVRGSRLGVADGRGRVRLGARRRGDRQGYVDPLGLLGSAVRAPPAVVGRRFGPPGARPATWWPRVVRVRRVGARVRASARRAGMAAWLGAGLLAVALGAGVTRRGAGRRVASATPCRSTSPRRSTT
jgi:hypothetical protein